MADNDDDGSDAGDVDTLDVRGDDAGHPVHKRLRSITHALVHEFDASAVVIVVLRNGKCMSNTMLHCSVTEEAHPDIGRDLSRGMQTCIGQLEDALINDAGNRGRQETH